MVGHFTKQVGVVLRRLSGYNTRWALKVTDGAIDGGAEGGADPAAVMVFFDANDAILSDKARAHQHVPLMDSGSVGEKKAAKETVVAAAITWPTGGYNIFIPFMFITVLA